MLKLMLRAHADPSVASVRSKLVLEMLKQHRIDPNTSYKLMHNNTFCLVKTSL